MQKEGYATFNSTTQAWDYDYTALQGSWTSFVQVRFFIFKLFFKLFCYFSKLIIK